MPHHRNSAVFDIDQSKLREWNYTRYFFCSWKYDTGKLWKALVHDYCGNGFVSVLNARR